MTLTRRTTLGLLAAAPFVAGAQAQPAWPHRPVRCIVPYPPGGGADTVARIFVPVLNEQPGAPQLVIDNRGGAGGNVGAEILARSAPDGATLGTISIGTHGTNPHMFVRQGFDPEKDFSPVSLISLQPVVFAVNAASPIKTLDELLATRREMTFGSSGNGTSGHLAGEVLRARSGLPLIHVPYRGAGPAWADLMAGRVDIAVDNIHVALPHHQAGRVRIVGITSRAASPLLPDVQVLGARFQDSVVYSWNGIAGPAGLAAPLVQQLHGAVASAWKDATLRRRYGELGIEIPEDSNPENFAAFIRREIAFWGPICRDANIRAE